ncbi:hypothetical protein E8E12_000516 [Didymella heteroderae]|uniref:Uncharacterized protein n=1 Tax=Didymella heteroderae TaxID=1769908 RepID=A0A9P5BV40_9PLEO|nr:hypothetical protein E8E12_000516 [Didymella heteroderae]
MSGEGSDEADEEDEEVAVAASGSEVVDWDAPDELPLHERGFMRRDRERRLKAGWNY